MKTIRVIFAFLFLVTSFSIWSQTVYTTKSGEKYHKENCRFLNYSKKAINIDKAKQLGYTACKVCKPTTENTTSEKTTKGNSLSGSNKSNTSKHKKIEATQCTGKTKSGQRCKRKTKNSNGRCFQH